ncbi:hypothetical protein Gohar_002522 [Gossypium harknessii]|uniref:RNase H type-1 domain-containing protein n=1 Tax=Gossypium harknessii TaxID=34285 RepID=A0A7J9HL35_9ROSI|nr:hypothetical protein [Gossypium harknessii]
MTGNWIHLFTDGAVKLNAGWAAAGGVAYNLEVVKALQDIPMIELTSALVRRIHMILKTMEQWEIKHIPR